MDTSKFLGKFKDATEDHLQRMNELLLRLEQEPGRPEEISELLREIHTLKGESRMMGFSDMSLVAHAIEDVLKAQEATGFAQLSEVSDELFEGFDVLSALMAEKMGEAPKGHDVPALCARLGELAGGGSEPAGAASPAQAPPPPPSDEGGFGDLDLGDLDLPDDAVGFEPPPEAGDDDQAAAMAEAFGVPEGVATEVEQVGAPPPTQTPGVSVGGGTSKFLGKFRDATLDHLQAMNRIVLALEQDPGRSDEVTELLREIHTLKGEARMMGYGDMSDVAHAVEDLLKAQADEGWASLAEVSDAVFEAFDAESELLEAKVAGTEAAVDVAALVERLEALARGERPHAAAAPAEPEPAERPQVDPSTAKFLGKFADATRDHLERMNALVLQLEAAPDSPGEVSELMREIHTIKGEARMMGFGDMADLAHVTEDLLKAQQAEGFASLGEHADLIFEAFDAEARLLEEKLSGVAAPVDLAALHSRLAAAAAGEAPPAPAPAPTADEPAASERAPAAPELEPLDPLLSEGFLDSAGAQAERLRELAGTWSPESSPREMERSLKGLEGEAGLAGFDELLPLLQALGQAAKADRLDALRAGVEELLPAARERAEGRDPGPRLEPLLRRLEGREEPPARPPEPEPPPALGTKDQEARPSAGETEPKPPPGVGLTSQGETAKPPPPKPAPRRAKEPAAAAAAGPATMPAPKAAGPAKVDQTLRISLGKLEELGNLTGDIYLNHTRAVDRQRQLRLLLDVAARQARAAGSLRQALGREGAGESSLAAGSELAESYEQVVETHRILRRSLQEMLHADRDEYLHATHQIVDLRERVRALQMLPVSTLFDMYPRMVRDIAKELGKKVRLQVEGAGTELDRRILDEIRDPMVHLIRNSIDHGIESAAEREAAGKPAQGTVRLAARAEGDHVVVEIEDDGGGIDPQKIKAAALKKGVITEAEAGEIDDEQAMQLIFAPGFSSKEAVSDLSGRGVGMDVVRQKVESLEGRIGVYSEVGQGTRMALRLPLTLAMARVLLLRAGGLHLAVPATFVAEVLRVAEERVRRVEAYEAIEWQGRTIPIVSLANVLEREARPDDENERTVVVLGFEEHLVGFVADGLEGEREVVVKRLDDFLGRVRNVAGATILSSGEIVVVLHVPQLIASTMGVSPLSLRAHLREPGVEEEQEGAAKRLLVVDDSIIVRDMMKGVLEGAGFEVTLAVDGMDGLEKQLAGAHDLVITDVEMPRMNGFELTKTLKQNEQQGDVPIIIVTTLDSPESKAKGLEAGASAYVVKNLLDMSQLIETIHRLVS